MWTDASWERLELNVNVGIGKTPRGCCRWIVRTRRGFGEWVDLWVQNSWTQMSRSQPKPSPQVSAVRYGYNDRLLFCTHTVSTLKQLCCLTPNLTQPWHDFSLQGGVRKVKKPRSKLQMASDSLFTGCFLLKDSLKSLVKWKSFCRLHLHQNKPL